MMRLGKYSFGNRGFTLIELLVVVGIIGVLAGGIGVALRGTNPITSLRAAQGMASGALSAARGQAALSQSTARIIVQADRSRDDFLRTIRIVVLDSGNWKQVGTDFALPEGTYVVPPVANLDGVTLDATNGGAWNVGRRSTLFGNATASVAGITDSTTWLISKDINPLGSVDGGGRLVVASGRRSGASSIVLDNAAAVRGLSISRYGVATLVDEPGSFDLITN